MGGLAYEVVVSMVTQWNRILHCLGGNERLFGGVLLGHASIAILALRLSWVFGETNNVSRRTVQSTIEMYSSPDRYSYGTQFHFA